MLGEKSKTESYGWGKIKDRELRLGNVLLPAPHLLNEHGNERGDQESS